MGPCGIKALVVWNQSFGEFRKVCRILRLPVSEKRAILGQIVNIIHGINPYHIPLGIALFRLDPGHGLRAVSYHHLYIVSGGFLKHIADHRIKVIEINQKRLRLLRISFGGICSAFTRAALRCRGLCALRSRGGIRCGLRAGAGCRSRRACTCGAGCNRCHHTGRKA